MLTHMAAKSVEMSLVLARQDAADTSLRCLPRRARIGMKTVACTVVVAPAVLAPVERTGGKTAGVTRVFSRVFLARRAGIDRYENWTLSPLGLIG
jgi:hypothetical protein